MVRYTSQGSALTMTGCEIVYFEGVVGMKKSILKTFQNIPGVGISIAQDLWDLGLRSCDDVKRSDPELLYRQLCSLRGTHIDRCVLYVFRCAVYYTSEVHHDPELLQWWNWKD